MTYKKWLVHCGTCDKDLKLWAWSNELPPKCLVCDEPTSLWDEKKSDAPAVIGDDIPGGVEIRHLGPTPQRFYSKTDIRRAANEGGWTMNGDTPVPYKVSWSGKRK